ncbi:hypothetical protein [Streptomyces flaveolus]|uniref:hypothetical protein n=1 Tax=Streptomyces flaveolus TaxID=67297 RepID=UPI003702987A
MNVRRFGQVLAAVALLVPLAVGCGDTDGKASDGKTGSSATASAPAPKKSTAPADVKLVKKGWEDHDVWGPHSYVVHWELTNTGAAQGDFFARLDFLDKDGDVLGSTGITADKVGPGKTARGDSAPLNVETDKGEMSDIVDAKVSTVERLDY